MLSLLTPWGIFRFWWVSVKFVLTLGGLYLGIAHLGGWLHQALSAAAVGASGSGPAFRVMAGGIAMIVVLAFMAWVSAAKPWGRTRAAGRATAPAPHATWFAMAVAVPFLDTAAVLAGVLPGPLLSIVSLIGYAAYRRAGAHHPVPSRRTRHLRAACEAVGRADGR